MSSLRKTRNVEIWAYDANNLELVIGTFQSMKKAADHFKVTYFTILRHLDTNKATIKDNKKVLFFSKKLTLEEINNIKVKNIQN